MTVTEKQVIAIVGPGIAWAVHFIAIYALISAACAPRALIDFQGLSLLGGLVTALGLFVCLWPVFFPPASESRDMARAAFWSGAIFALAVFAGSAILFFFDSCGG